MEKKENKRSMVWGVLLITFGAAALVDIFYGISDWMMAGLFALGGVLALIVFLFDRKDWQLLIPPYILFAIAGIIALAVSDLLNGEFIAVFVLSLVAVPFLAVFLFDRANWWALIPAYVMLFVIGIIVLTTFNIITGGWVPFYVLGMVGLPFLVVYLVNRTNWWALIPAYVMFVVGTMVLLIDARILNDFGVPSYIMLAIALPFFVVYFSNKEQRWALIPGSITGVIGLGFLAGTTIAQYLIPVVLIVAGAWVLMRTTKKS